MLFPVAAMTYVVELVTALFGLPAMLAVLLNGDPEVFFRLVDIALTSRVLVGEGLHGRSHEANHRQQGDTKNPYATFHSLSPSFCKRLNANPGPAPMLRPRIRVSVRCGAIDTCCIQVCGRGQAGGHHLDTELATTADGNFSLTTGIIFKPRVPMKLSSTAPSPSA